MTTTVLAFDRFVESLSGTGESEKPRQDLEPATLAAIRDLLAVPMPSDTLLVLQWATRQEIRRRALAEALVSDGYADREEI